MKFEFSAGGIVYRRGKTQKKNASRKNAEIYILVAKHSQHHGWVFPKGLIGDTDENKHQSKSAYAKSSVETKEKAAVREVKEETGIEAVIEKEIKPVTYWYVWEGVKIKKTVYYFTMEAIGGDIKDHDEEMEEVEWIDYNDVEKRLTYPSDKKAWNEAKSIISQNS